MPAGMTRATMEAAMRDPALLANKKSHLGPKIQSLNVSVNLKATDTDVCRYTIIISKV
jgi:hypothetical protein